MRGTFPDFTGSLLVGTVRPQSRMHECSGFRAKVAGARGGTFGPISEIHMPGLFPLTNINWCAIVCRMSTQTPSNLRPLPVRHKNAPCCAPAAAPSLTRVGTQTLAARLKALSDPTRLRMLDLLAQQAEPLCVCDITPQFEQNQPTISHHLKLLREAGLIDCEKRGIWAHYWATDLGRRCLSAVEKLT